MTATVQVGLDHVKMMMSFADVFIWILAYHPDLEAPAEFCAALTHEDEEPFPVDVSRAEVEELVEALQEFLKVSKEMA